MHGKPVKLKEFEKVSKFQENSGKFKFLKEKPGKFRENEKCDMIANQNVFHPIFLF